MGKTEYQELTDYLNEVCLDLRINDSFFLDNIGTIMILSDTYIEHVDNHKLESKEITNHLTFDEILELAREIVENINPKYLPSFDSMISDGTLDLSYEREYVGSHFSYNQGTSSININRVFSYTDVITLIHEFLHYTNGNHANPTLHQYVLTEFISIYFEIYAAYYLKNVKKIDSINFNDRILDSLKICYDLHLNCIPLIMFEKFGDLSDFSFQLFNSYFGELDKNDFEEMCKELLTQFRLIKNKYLLNIQGEKKFNHLEFREKLSRIYKSYKHLLGTLLAVYAFYHCNIKDIVKLNDKINSDEFAVKNMSEVLKTIQINMEDEKIIPILINNIIKYIEDNNQNMKYR